MEQAKLTNSLQLRLSDQELAELDAYCVALRRRTGAAVPRTAVIREAVQEKLARGLQPAGEDVAA